MTGQLGGAVSEPQLWQLISPTPQLDAKHTLFEQLALAHTVPARDTNTWRSGLL